MKDYCLLVTTKPVPGQEDVYNAWYNDRHIPDVLAIPGFVAAQRFAAEVEGETRYLALYSLQTDDPAAAMAELEARAGTARMEMSPALDAASASATLYSALGPRQTAPRA